MRKFQKLLMVFFVWIMLMASVFTAYGAGWSQEGGYWWYQNGDGSYACNGSQYIEGRLYSFDENGHLKGNRAGQNRTSDEAVYQAFLAQNYSGKRIKIALADLTHDGQDNLVVVWTDHGAGITSVGIYGIVQNQVREISRETYRNFRNSLSLCIKDEKACLLETCEGIYQGEGDLSYTLYDFNGDYTRNVLDEYSVHVILDTAQGDRDSAIFYEKANAYQQGSVLVACDDQSSLWPEDSVFP